MNLDAVARLAAAGILNSLLAGIAIAVLAWTVTRLFRRQDSGTRFAVWFLALIAIGVLPFVGNVASASHAARKLGATSAITLPQSFATYLFVASMVGATLGLLHVAHGLYRLRRLRATCTPVDLDQLDATSRAILVEARKHRRITLCTSDAVRVPAAIGYFRPVVVFPTWALTEIPPAELNAILLHELAHLRRWDDFSNLAQKVLKAVFFFHPAVWFIESRLTLEREMACDDAVLAASFSPHAYAESLVGLAEKSFLRRGVQLAQAAVSHVQQLKLRLAEILRKDKPRQGSGVGKPAIALMGLVGIVSAYGVAHAPRLVGFSSDPPQLTAASATMPQALSRERDTQLQPVSLRCTAKETPAVLILSTSKIHKSSRLQVGLGDAKKNKLRVPRAEAYHERARRVVMSPGTLQLHNDVHVLIASGASRWDVGFREIQAAERPAAEVSTPVLVLFQSEQFGPDGPISWRVTIVHFTPTQRALTGGIAKQI